MSWLWTYALALLASAAPMRIVVNIPAFRLDVYVADSVTRSMPIAPGMPSFRTPRGEFAIASVEWNPWWIPPDRSWAAKEKPMRPGPVNPMGRVKLNFRALYFLHGTPLERSIGSAASHGCIRLKNADAIELARLVHRFGSPALTADEVERLATDTATRTILLDEPIPIEIRYDRVEVRAGRVTVYRDVYGLATRSLRAELSAALSANGVDTTRLYTARAGALVRRVGPRGNSALLTSLIKES